MASNCRLCPPDDLESRFPGLVIPRVLCWECSDRPEERLFFSTRDRCGPVFVLRNLRGQAVDRCRYVMYDPAPVPRPHDFVSFFDLTIVSAKLAHKVEFQYEHFGLELLFRDLELGYATGALTDRHALGKVFLALNQALMDCADELDRSPPSASHVLRPTVRASDETTAIPRDVLMDLNARRRKKYDFGFVFRAVYEATKDQYLDPRLDVVRSAYVSGNVVLLEEMLKFGATMFRPQDSVREWERVHTVTNLLLVMILPLLLHPNAPHFCLVDDAAGIH